MSRFCIVLAEQPHRQVFAEVLESLTWGLRELGHDVEHAISPDRYRRNIILAPHLLLASDENVSVAPGTIVYNGEPHVSPLFVRSLRLLGHRNVVAWDYSSRNVAFLHELGVRARHVPYAWAPPLCRRDVRVMLEARDIDIVFVGSQSPRRTHVLELLAKTHPELTVKTLYGVYGVARDFWLNQSRVALNVHYFEDEPPNEDLRLLVACASAVAVVSEGTPDDPYKADWAVWTPYRELVERVAELVHSGRWKEQAALGFASVMLRNAADVMKQALEGEDHR
jgi:hypothetical protein